MVSTQETVNTPEMVSTQEMVSTRLVKTGGRSAAGRFRALLSPSRPSQFRASLSRRKSVVD
jgi:hypothetical protein